MNQPEVGKQIITQKTKIDSHDLLIYFYGNFNLLISAIFLIKYAIISTHYIGNTMKRFMVFLLASLLPLHSFAAFDCNVQILRVLIYSDGAVNVIHSGRNDYTVICNLNSSYGKVSPTTCAMWTATLQSIKKKGGTAIFYFDGEGTCATLKTYGDALIPSYIGDI